MPPDLTDLSALTEAAALAESLLLDWMRNSAADPSPPPIKDITVATQALWRLTAVRKTLLGLDRSDPDRFDPDPWSDHSTEATDEEIEYLIRRGEENDLAEEEDRREQAALESGARFDFPDSQLAAQSNLQSPSAPQAPAQPATTPRAPESNCQSSVLDFELPSRPYGAMVVPACPTIPAISIPGAKSAILSPLSGLPKSAAPNPEIPEAVPLAAPTDAPIAQSAISPPLSSPPQQSPAPGPEISEAAPQAGPTSAAGAPPGPLHSGLSPPF